MSSITDAGRKVAKQARELAGRRHFQPYVIDKTVGSRGFKFYVGDSEGERWYAADAHDDWLEMQFVEAHVARPGDIVFECGGHHGASAILLSAIVGPTGRIVTFEPSSGNVAILEQNIAINELANVQLERAAVGSAPGSLRMFKKSNASVLPTRWLSSGMANLIFGVEEVPVVTLDEYCAAHGVTPTVLKIDVEGFEAEVLRGAGDVMARAPKLALEIHTEVLERYRTSVSELLDLVGLDRYDAWVQWNDRESPRPFDGTEPITHRVHLFAVPKRSAS